MFFSDLADPSNGFVDAALLEEFQPQIDRVRTVVGVFIALALFFHQQSFPSCAFVGGSAQASADAGRASGAEKDGASRAKKAAQEQYADVVRARKRSAIVSIILVDMPFFAIRTYVWALSLSSLHRGGSMFNSTITGILWPQYDGYEETPGKSQLDKWWVKNILCMLLQAMQLRFVQQADLERSQSLRWWERGRMDVDAGSARRRHRNAADPSLRRAWEEMYSDRNKLEAAMAAAGGIPAPAEATDGGGGGAATSACAEGPAAAAAVDALSDSADGGASADAAAPASSAATGAPGRPAADAEARKRRPSRLRRCLVACCCCCCRREGRRCRCCSCDCSHSILLHGLMGLVLGWLIAKVDFSQASTDLALGLGWDA